MERLSRAVRRCLEHQQREYEDWLAAWKAEHKKRVRAAFSALKEGDHE